MNFVLYKLYKLKEQHREKSAVARRFPCIGIIRVRCNGYYLSLPFQVSTPIFLLILWQR